MGNINRKVYCSESAIISSLGITTEANRLAIEDYNTAIVHYKDSTPVCLIDRSALPSVNLEKYTFAEQITIQVLENIITKTGKKLNDSRSLLIISTTKGNIEYLNNDLEKCYLSNLANRVAEYFDATNTPLVVSNACVSGVEAVIIGTRFIEENKYDTVFVAGVDVVSEFVVAGFNSFKSISPTICRPYDASRDGLTLGEAAAAILLTSDAKVQYSPTNNGSLDTSLNRGESHSDETENELSTPIITIAGGGMSCDANHISGPSRTGDGLALAIKAALSESKLSPSDISMINMHGTGTPFNDEMESKALALMELTNVPCNSLKPYIGHTLGAAGVIEIILAIEQLKRDYIFGTKGYETNGVPVELNIKAEHRNIKLNNVLKTASGFGGTNAAIVIAKEIEYNDSSATHPHSTNVQKDCEKSSAQDTKFDTTTSVSTNEIPKQSDCQGSSSEITITELSEVKITKTEQIFSDFIRQANKDLGHTNLKFFKMDDLCKLGYVASCQLLKGVELSCFKDRVGIILASKSGSLQTDLHHQEMVNKHLSEGTSPAVFVYTLANIVAAEIAIQHKFKGELMLFIQETKQINFLSNYAQQLIKAGRCDAVIYGWCELLGEEYEAELKLITKI